MKKTKKAENLRCVLIVEQRNEEDADEEYYEIERQTYAHKVSKLVSSHALHNEIGLVTNGGTERCTGGKADTNKERHGVATELVADAHSKREC